VEKLKQHHETYLHDRIAAIVKLKRNSREISTSEREARNEEDIFFSPKISLTKKKSTITW
jgi:hypothetical protein